jgi:hypothetical protein
VVVCCRSKEGVLVASERDVSDVLCTMAGKGVAVVLVAFSKAGSLNLTARMEMRRFAAPPPG